MTEQDIANLVIATSRAETAEAELTAMGAEVLRLNRVLGSRDAEWSLAVAGVLKCCETEFKTAWSPLEVKSVFEAYLKHVHNHYWPDWDEEDWGEMK